MQVEKQVVTAKTEVNVYGRSGRDGIQRKWCGRVR